MLLNNLNNVGLIRRWRTYKHIKKLRTENRFEPEAMVNSKNTLELPELESPCLAGVWVVELYPPSHASKLRDAIRDIGWDKDGLAKKKLDEWLDDTRYGRSSGWFNLGPVTVKKNSTAVVQRFAELPENICFAYPYLVSITPSITSLATLFVLDEDSANSISNVVRHEYKVEQTELVNKSIWSKLHYLICGNPNFYARNTRYPEQIREEKLKGILSGHVERCVHWKKRNFPGVFASSSQALDYPTACLILTEEVTPFSEQASKILELRGLRVSEAFAGWQCIESPALKFYTPSTWDEEGKRLTFSGRRSDIISDMDQQSNNHSVALNTHGKLLPIISEWAVSTLLNMYVEQLSTMRDDAATIGKFSPSKDLKKLRALSHTMLYDISVCVKEIPERSGFRGSLEPVSAKSIDNDNFKQRDFAQEATKIQMQRAKQLKHQTETLSQVLSQTGHISQTISNLWTQRFVAALTIVSIVISTLAFLSST